MISTLYSSENPECYIGLDVGENYEVKIEKIRYLPNPDWSITGEVLDGALFEGS